MELPRELVRHEVLLRLPPEEIINYCLTTRIAADICRDQSFWTEKLRRDFNLPLGLIPGTPYQQYQEHYWLSLGSANKELKDVIAKGYTDMVPIAFERELRRGRGRFDKTAIWDGAEEAAAAGHLGSILAIRKLVEPMFLRYNNRAGLAELFERAFLAAARTGRKEIVDALKDLPVKLYEAVQLAIINHHFNIADDLMQGEDPEEIWSNVNRTLDHAIKNSDWEILHYLLPQFRDYFDLERDAESAEEQDHPEVAAYLRKFIQE